MAIDKLGCYKKKQHVKTFPKSQDPYLALLVRFYKTLVRRTGAAFNAEVLRRLVQSRTNRPVVSTSRLAQLIKRSGDENKVAVVVATVVDDPRLLDVPKMTVAALRFTSSARARIVKNGGECITLDELAVRQPTGAKTLLVRGYRTGREAFRYFGAPAGSRRNGAKPRAPKASKMGKKHY